MELVGVLRSRTLSEWKQLRRNWNTCSVGNEETSLAGVGIAFQGVEWDEWKGQFQIVEGQAMKARLGMWTLSLGELLKVFWQKPDVMGKGWFRVSIGH